MLKKAAVHPGTSQTCHGYSSSQSCSTNKQNVGFPSQPSCQMNSQVLEAILWLKDKLLTIKSSLNSLIDMKNSSESNVKSSSNRQEIIDNTNTADDTADISFAIVESIMDDDGNVTVDLNY